MKSKIFLFTVCFCLAFTAFNGNAVWAGSFEKQAKIKQLLSVTDWSSMLEEMVPIFSNIMVKDLKKKGVEITAETIDVIKKSTTDVMKASVAPYINRVVGMYNEAYSEEEIDELLAFYSSPTGRKSLHQMAQIQQDAKALGMKWGRSITPQIKAEVTTALKLDSNKQQN